MRAHLAFATLFALALTLGAGPAAACHGTVTPITVTCVNNNVPCPTFYFVASPLGGGMVLAFYQETNNVPGLQRGDAPTLQGGNDDCWQGPSLDTRIF